MNISHAGRWAGILGLSLALVTSSGCSLFQPHTQPVTIISSDPSAKIEVDNKVVGTGRVNVELSRNQTHTVIATNPSGKTGGGYIRTKLSTTGVLDIVGGCIFLIPIIGALSPGFWELEPGLLQVEVTK